MFMSFFLWGPVFMCSFFWLDFLLLIPEVHGCQVGMKNKKWDWIRSFFFVDESALP